MVYIINYDGKPLMPTERYGKVRRMLNSGKAKVVNRRPFTIQLTYQTTNYTQSVTVGIDASNSMVGVSASTEEKEIYASEVELRKDVSLLLKQKNRLKNARRRRNHRKARPNEKKKSIKNSPYYEFEGKYKKKRKAHVKLKVSSEQKIQSHISIVNRLSKIVPISKIVVETGQFDKSIIDNKQLEHTKMYSSNQREYVLNRDHHICQWCKGKHGDKILVTRNLVDVPVIYPEFYHFTNNMVTLCKTCSDHIDKLKEKYEELRKEGRKPRGRNYKSVTEALRNIVLDKTNKPLVGKMRMRVFRTLEKEYSNVESVKGYIIKQMRVDKGLENRPINNARIMTGCHSKYLEKYHYIKLRRCHDRQIQKVKPSKKSGLRSLKSPYFTKGFASYDLVLYNGKEYYITKKRKSGYFALGTADGTTLIGSVKWDKLKLVQRRRSYSVETREC